MVLAGAVVSAKGVVDDGKVDATEGEADFVVEVVWVDEAGWVFEEALVTVTVTVL